MAGYNQIKLAIVEDEWIISKFIRNIIESNFDSIVVCGEFKTVSSAAEGIRKHLPDIVLLDVELEDGTSFDVLGKVTDLEFQKIFITSYSQHALKAIKAHAVDYHLKPINETELIDSVNNCINIIKRNEIVQLTQPKLEVSLNQKSKEDERYLIINKKTERILIEYSKIVYIMSDNAYTTVYYLDNKKINSVHTSISIKKMEEIIPSSYFFRIHNRYIINTNYFERLEGTLSKMQYDISLPTSIEKAKILKTRFI